MCRVVGVSDRYIEVEGKLRVGEIVKAGRCLAVVVSVSGEKPEYIKYAGELNKKEIEAYLPDVLNSRVTSKCYILGGLEENLCPEIGEEVLPASDEDLREYHTKNGELTIPYFYQMLKTCDIEISKSVIKRLIKIFDKNEILEALLRELDYMTMRSMGL